MAAADNDTFERARADFLRGLAALEAGRFDAAEAHFLASLAHVPGRVSTLINLAATRLALGRAGDALENTDQVLAIEPDNPEAFLHRGTALSLLGRHAHALACHERLLALGAPPGPVWLRHGQTLQALDLPEQALRSYDRALAADPTLAQAWTNCGNILREMQRSGEAAKAFRQALAHGADPALHGYYLASLGADAVPAIAPAHYVETLFDDYADNFDAHLVGTLAESSRRVACSAFRPSWRRTRRRISACSPAYATRNRSAICGGWRGNTASKCSAGSTRRSARTSACPFQGCSFTSHRLTAPPPDKPATDR